MQKRARISLTWKLFSRSFGLYQWLFLILYLATSVNTQCWKNLTSSFFNNLRAVSFSSKVSIDSNKPLSSKYSHLEYWYLLTVAPTKQFAHSVLYWLAWRRKVLNAYSLRWNAFLFIFAKVKSNLFRYSRAKAITLYLDSFFSTVSDSDILI